MQPAVLGLINNTHAAPAELLDDAVVRDGLINHWAAILETEGCQVNEGWGVGGASAGRLAKHLRYTN
jgi:hypothetical protein